MTFISNGSTLSVAISFETIVCYKCGLPFAVPARFRKELVETHETFYCPSGHAQSYNGQSTEERMQKIIDQKNRELQLKEIDKIQLEAQVNTLNRKLKRIHKGTCPCCNRSFQNLKRHMETKHPEIVNKSK